jgi:hypothetical protein
MTAPALSLDIGFDRKGLPKPDDATHAGLTDGFTILSEDGNPVALARGLTKGSHLTLTLYDLTEPAGESLPVEIDHLSLSVEIGKAREQQDDQPFELLGGGSSATTRWDTYRIYRALADTGLSTVFGGHYPSWNVHRPDDGAATYPDDQLGPDRQPPQATFEVARDGYYYFTLRLDVGWTDAAGQRHSKSYRQDPEMIIDTT